MELKKVQSNIGMGILLISWSMLFAALFLGYFVFRFSQESWPPMGMPKVSLFWPSVSSLILLASSASYHKFQTLFFGGQKEESGLFLKVTFFLSVLFLGSQFALWHELKISGLYVSAGIFPSLLYGFTWIHAAHVVFGFIAFFILGFSLFYRNFLKMGELSVINIGRFWHFLGIVWLVMYLGLFVF